LKIQDQNQKPTADERGSAADQIAVSDLFRSPDLTITGSPDFLSAIIRVNPR
jgi:hypothetical protein